MPNRNVLAKYREVRAVELMTAGATYQQAADELGYRSRAGVWYAVQRALDRRTVDAVDLYRLVELENLDRLQARAWKRANAGDLDAVGKVVAIINARCRLLGLYADWAEGEERTEATSPRTVSADEQGAVRDEAEFGSLADGLARLYSTAAY
ncbi:MAG: hypothetical protein WCP95_15430 [Actinomycetes bacterium]